MDARRARSLARARPAGDHAVSGRRRPQPGCPCPFSTEKLYVASFGSDASAAGARARLTDRLRRDPTLAIVDDTQLADAIVKGTAQVWVAGHFYTSPRSKSFRQDSYNGFLSVELVGKNGDTLRLISRA